MILVLGEKATMRNTQILEDDAVNLIVPLGLAETPPQAYIMTNGVIKEMNKTLINYM